MRCDLKELIPIHCNMIFATYCAILLDVAILPKMRILRD